MDQEKGACDEGGDRQIGIGQGRACRFACRRVRQGQGRDQGQNGQRVAFAADCAVFQD
jgi:hypothetical protein